MAQAIDDQHMVALTIPTSNGTDSSMLSVPDWAVALCAAVARSDEAAFIVALRVIKWDGLSAEDWELVIRLALEAGAHAEARELAAEAARHYPHDQKLRGRADLLAPPRVLGTHPAEPEAAAMQKANFAWLRAHGSDYQGQWVALRGATLVGAASSLRELHEQVGDAKGTFFSRVL